MQPKFYPKFPYLQQVSGVLTLRRFSKQNNSELIELSSINKVSLVQVSSCCNTGSIRDDPKYWTSRKNSLELTELSSIKKVGLG